MASLSSFNTRQAESSVRRLLRKSATGQLGRPAAAPLSRPRSVATSARLTPPNRGRLRRPWGGLLLLAKVMHICLGADCRSPLRVLINQPASSLDRIPRYSQEYINRAAFAIRVRFRFPTRWRITNIAPAVRNFVISEGRNEDFVDILGFWNFFVSRNPRDLRPEFSSLVEPISSF